LDFIYLFILSLFYDIMATSNQLLPPPPQLIQVRAVDIGAGVFCFVVWFNKCRHTCCKRVLSFVVTVSSHVWMGVRLFGIHRILILVFLIVGSRGSSGSTVSDYGLDDRAIGVRSPAGTEDFTSILCVQTGSEAHPASCTMGTGGPFPGAKARPGRDADH
jgi:hypothetical protein